MTHRPASPARPSRRVATAAVPLLCAALAACGGDGATAGFAGTVDTLPGGTIASRSPAKGMWGQGEAWTLVPELTIGAEDGDGADVFGQVAALEMDARGRIYVVEGQAHEVRVFDAAGRHVRTLGRKGGGPGEFDQPAAAFWKDGHLWVVDQGNARFTVFDTAGTLVATHRRGTGGFMWFPWPGRVDRQGRIHDLLPLPTQGDFRTGLARLDTAFAAADTFVIPESKGNYFELVRGRGRTRTTVPFTPSRTVQLDRDGNVWTADDGTYRLSLVSFDGDTLRTVEKEHTPVPVTGEERDSALARLKWFRDQGGTVDASRIPGTKPAFGTVYPDENGYLWVAPQRAGEGARLAFDVFDPDGRYLGLVEPPVDLQPFALLIRGDVMLALVDDEMDIPRVIRLRIQKGKAAAPDA
jgi:sugar lactone lactonase YvrE